MKEIKYSPELWAKAGWLRLEGFKVSRQWWGGGCYGDPDMLKISL